MVNIAVHRNTTNILIWVMWIIAPPFMFDDRSIVSLCFWYTSFWMCRNRFYLARIGIK
jgi:hypothetical protein